MVEVARGIKMGDVMNEIGRGNYERNTWKRS